MMEAQAPAPRSLASIPYAAEALAPRRCKGAACPAFATCQGRGAATLALETALAEARAENRG